MPMIMVTTSTSVSVNPPARSAAAVPPAAEVSHSICPAHLHLSLLPHLATPLLFLFSTISLSTHCKVLSISTFSRHPQHHRRAPLIAPRHISHHTARKMSHVIRIVTSPTRATRTELSIQARIDNLKPPRIQRAARTRGTQRTVAAPGRPYTPHRRPSDRSRERPPD